jgi:hypothetical protein
MAVQSCPSTRSPRRLGLLAVLTLLALALLPAQGTTAEAAGAACPCSLFADTATPGTPNDPDADAATQGIEVGVAFTADTPGYISAVRFYRGSANSGMHTGSLWTAGGSRLGSGWFRGETAAGWQTMPFRSPIAIAAGATYVASYHTNAGAYSSDAGFFETPLPASHLHGTTGVYAYGESRFPEASFDGSNYWVDVVFDTVVRPALTEPLPAAGSFGAAPAGAILGGFNEAVVPSSLRMEVRDPSGALVPGTVQYSIGTGSAVFAPGQPLLPGTRYRATVSQAVDAAGRGLAAPFTWTFTTRGQCPCALIPLAAAPPGPPSDDAQPVELGMRFRPIEDSAIVGIRFYRQDGNDGPHAAHLWDSSGQLLATAPFSSETGTGWQTALLANPVAVSPLKTYVASYHTASGRYSETDDGLQDFLSDGHLSVLPPTPLLGSKGVYAYGPPGTFPGGTYRADNYWVTPLSVPAAPAPGAEPLSAARATAAG